MRRAQDDEDQHPTNQENDHTSLYKSMSVKELRKLVIEKKGKVKGIAKFKKDALIELLISNP